MVKPDTERVRGEASQRPQPPPWEALRVSPWEMSQAEPRRPRLFSHIFQSRDAALGTMNSLGRGSFLWQRTVSRERRGCGQISRNTSSSWRTRCLCPQGDVSKTAQHALQPPSSPDLPAAYSKSPPLGTASLKFCSLGRCPLPSAFRARIRGGAVLCPTNLSLVRVLRLSLAESHSCSSPVTLCLDSP